MILVGVFLVCSSARRGERLSCIGTAFKWGFTIYKGVFNGRRIHPINYRLMDTDTYISLAKIRFSSLRPGHG